MNDHLFTAPAHWGWLVVFYFFLGGLSAGTYVLSAMLDLLGGPEHRAAARLGYLASFTALALCPPLLILDLDRPLRFWHLMIMSQRPGLMLKWYSPMSLGSWALLAFGACSFAAFLAALADPPSGPRFGRLGALLRALRAGAPGKVLAVLGGAFGFFVAGYTGVLLSVTNRPVWADTPMLGALFLLSSATASAALLSLLAGRSADTSPASAAWLHGIERQAAIVELVVLAAFLAIQGKTALLWPWTWAAALAFAVVFGMLAPVLLSRRAGAASQPSPRLGLVLVLASSLLLRAAVVFASEAVHRA